MGTNIFITIVTYSRQKGALQLRGLALVSQAEGQHMLKHGGGKIINTASMAAVFVPHPQKQIAYNASKAAVVKITETLGTEWADRNVRVNCISPGIVNTALIQVRWLWQLAAGSCTRKR